LRWTNNEKAWSFYQKAYAAIKKTYAQYSKNTNQAVYIYLRLLVSELLLRMAKFAECGVSPQVIANFVSKTMTIVRPHVEGFNTNNQFSTKNHSSKNNNGLISDDIHLETFYWLICSNKKNPFYLQDARALYKDKVSFLRMYCHIEFCLNVKNSNLINPDTKILYEKEALDSCIELFANTFTFDFQGRLSRTTFYQMLSVSLQFLEFIPDKQLDSHEIDLIIKDFRGISYLLDYGLKTFLPIIDEFPEFPKNMIGLMSRYKHVLKDKFDSCFFDMILGFLERVIRFNNEKPNKDLLDSLRRLKIDLTKIEKVGNDSAKQKKLKKKKS
jgi:hypothetical protein